MKTIEIVNAYNILRELNLSEMSDESMNGIWDNITNMRPIVNEYNLNMEDRQKTLYDKKMQVPIQEYYALAEKIRKGYIPTSDEIENTKPAEKHILKINSTIAELGNKEVNVDLIKISSQDLLKALKSNKKSFKDMEILEILTK